jgi:hypothetical protein
VAEELRLVPCLFGELAVGDRYIWGNEPRGDIMTKTNACYDERSFCQVVLRVIPAQPQVDVARVLALLKRLEWTGWNYEEADPICPVCREPEYYKEHSTDCELVIVIRELEGANGNGD